MAYLARCSLLKYVLRSVRHDSSQLVVRRTLPVCCVETSFTKADMPAEFCENFVKAVAKTLNKPADVSIIKKMI